MDAPAGHPWDGEGMGQDLQGDGVGRMLEFQWEESGVLQYAQVFTVS